jgi:hypothetical protein
MRRIPDVLVNLAEMAYRGGDGDWEAIDAELVTLTYNTPEVITWALGYGLEHQNPNLRNLAVTILNHYDDVSLSPNDQESVGRRMKYDQHDVVRYRCALALYQRGSREVKVLRTLKKGRGHKGVGELIRTWVKE